MTQEEQKYLQTLINEAKNSIISCEVYDNPSQEMIEDICCQIDEIKIPISENSYSDITGAVIWSIVDICSVFVPPLKSLKAGKGAVKSFKVLSKTIRNILWGSTKGKKALGKFGTWVMRLLLAISVAGEAFEGTPYNGPYFGARVKLPLINTETLKNQSEFGQKLRNISRVVGEFIFAPMSYIGEFTDKLRNEARRLSNQMLKQLNQEMIASAGSDGKKATLVNRIWIKLKNTFFNGQTSTDSVFTPEFFDSAKEKGIDLRNVETLIGNEYRNYCTKQYGKQLDAETLEEFIQLNVQNAAEWFHLDVNVMLQGAQINVSQEAYDNENSEETQDAQGQTQQPKAPQVTAQPNPVISQFQTWTAQVGFKDNQGQPLNADGLIGPKTRSVILAFQQWANQRGYSQNMPVDGKWGPLTAAAFNIARQSYGKQQPQQMQQQQPQTTTTRKEWGDMLPQVQNSLVAESVNQMKSLMERMSRTGGNKGSILL